MIGIVLIDTISVAYIANVQDNWQLAELPQSGGREFDIRRFHDDLSVPLWVYLRFKYDIKQIPGHDTAISQIYGSQNWVHEPTY